MNIEMDFNMVSPLSLQAAIQYQSAGICPIPIRADGSKAPLIKWKQFESRLPTSEEVQTFFGSNELGVALVCGKVSGNLETLDFETEDIFNDWRELVNKVQPNLINKLVITQTPGKYPTSSGRHVRYRVSDLTVPGNLKLASHLVLDSCECQACRGCRETKKEDKVVCLIETRGEGGYALAPGSVSTAHPFNRIYKNLQGTVSQVKAISAREREILIGCAESFNQQMEEPAAYSPTASGEVGDRPGDRYNQAGDFSILQKHGWKLVSQNEARCLWKRPGKDGVGISATTGYCRGKDGTPRLYVFSTNAQPFEANKYYSAFSVLSLLEFGGDFTKAALQLAGPQPARPTIKSPPAEVVAAEEAITDDGEVVTDKEGIEREPFPVGVFPEKLQQTMMELSNVIPCPVDTVGTVMLAYASLGIGNTRKISLKKSWEEPAALFVAVVAVPGEGKTPVMKNLKKPIQEWQRTLTDAYESAQTQHDEDMEQWEKNKESGAEAGPKPSKPKFKHVFTTDATTEKIASMLEGNPRGIGIDQDELAALVKGMNQYKANGQGRDRYFYLEGWSQQPLKVDRLGSEVPKQVYDPFFSVFGGTQPQMLGVLKDEFGREDGFVHRFLFCYPPRRVMKAWNDDEVSDEALANWTDCFNKLITLPMSLSEKGHPRAWFCRMTPEAKREWKKGYDALLPSLNSLTNSFGGAYHKLVAYAARLSLIMQMLYWATGEDNESQWVGGKAVWAGWKLATYYANQMRIVYTQIHDKPEDMRAKEYLEWVVGKGGKVTQREAMQFGPRWCRKRTSILKMFKDLEDRGNGKVFESEKQANGKTIIWFETNPQGDNDAK